MTKARKYMDIDNGSRKISKENIIDCKPVPAGATGVGLPYAPEDWPLPGDNWSWRVGYRKTASGYWIDRVISPPNYFPRISGGRARFQSKVSLVNYIRKEFPHADINAFFGSFTWKILADCTAREGGMEKLCNLYKCNGSSELSKHLDSESTVSSGRCKAGNEICARVKNRDFLLKVGACDICCAEPGFCGDCCCILCSRSVDSSYGGFSFIRCQAILERDLSCGHVAHIDCALRAYMAGTVGGSIGLDAEYYCRRCDNKTDLIQHAKKILETCKAFDSRDVIEKVLNLGSCILLSSEKVEAKKLHCSIRTILSKLKCGINLAEIWKVENEISIISTVDAACSEKEVILLDSPDNSIDNTLMESEIDLHLFLDGSNEGERHGPLCITSDHANVSAKLEDEIDHALNGLKKSQESEYRIAEEKLYAQKDFLLGLYQQLEAERCDFAGQTPLANGRDGDPLLTCILERVDQIKYEETKLKQMMRIAEGFARTPGAILREHFDIIVDD